jgi:hypothetical protein
MERFIPLPVLSLKSKIMKEALIVAVSTLISSFLTMLFYRGKLKNENKGTELDNVEKAVTIWRELYENLEKKVSVLEKKMIEMEKAYHDKCLNCEFIKNNLYPEK